MCGDPFDRRSQGPDTTKEGRKIQYPVRTMLRRGRRLGCGGGAIDRLRTERLRSVLLCARYVEGKDVGFKRYIGECRQGKARQKG